MAMTHPGYEQYLSMIICDNGVKNNYFDNNSLTRWQYKSVAQSK